MVDFKEKKQQDILKKLDENGRKTKNFSAKVPLNVGIGQGLTRQESDEHYQVHLETLVLMDQLHDLARKRLLI